MQRKESDMELVQAYLEKTETLESSVAKSLRQALLDDLDKRYDECRGGRGSSRVLGFREGPLGAGITMHHTDGPTQPEPPPLRTLRRPKPTPLFGSRYEGQRASETLEECEKRMDREIKSIDIGIKTFLLTVGLGMAVAIWNAFR
jgi:hypothetical protein